MTRCVRRSGRKPRVKVRGECQRAINRRFSSDNDTIRSGIENIVKIENSVKKARIIRNGNTKRSP